jgi:hypothetical protein
MSARARDSGVLNAPRGPRVLESSEIRQGKAFLRLRRRGGRAAATGSQRQSQRAEIDVCAGSGQTVDDHSRRWPGYRPCAGGMSLTFDDRPAVLNEHGSVIRIMISTPD